jgi:protein-L-isoaspartate(D-aspartate) O-methyltransferase
MTRQGVRLGRYLAIFLYAIYLPSSIADEFSNARRHMVTEIRVDVRQTSLYLDKEALDPHVMDAMAEVPRHEFVPEGLVSRAYENRPLPIGHGQTISQPYVVAVMTDLLKVGPDSRVLELGTGSAYQAAVLSRLVDRVYSIEIIEPLAAQARQRLARLGYDNVETRSGDGYYGWKEQAPFDAIIVTAAASHVPPPLIEQLKVGGRMVIPVGGRFTTQQLLLVHKESDDRVVTRQILPVTFVPVTGGH